MKSGKNSMGNRKHRTSGRPTKSPRFRHAEKLEAERQERKGAKPLPHGSVTDAFKAR